MRKIVIITLSIIFCAFTFNANALEKKRDLTNEEKIKVEEAVKQTLKDPDSAKFRHSKLILMDGSATSPYCGMVNAKNSYGGYTGYSIFFVGVTTNKSGERVVMYLGPNDESDAEQRAMINVCAKYGY